MLHFGWRMMFVIMGVAGMGVAAVFYAVYRNPSQCDLTVEERAYLADGGSPAPREAITLREWTHLFRFRTTWGMICGFSGTVYLLWIYNAWLPGYLQMERHFTISKTGWVAAIPFVFGIFGSLSGGQLCDYLVRRGVPPMRSRKWPMAIALLGGSLFTALAAVTPGNTLAISFIAAAMFLLYLASSAAWAMAPAPPRWVPSRISAASAEEPSPRPSPASSCRKRPASPPPCTPGRPSAPSPRSCTAFLCAAPSPRVAPTPSPPPKSDRCTPVPLLPSALTSVAPTSKPPCWSGRREPS
jgi:hypothetical protein